VPATRPDRIDKALATSADVVIIDLEDAVSADDKNSARQIVSRLEPSRPFFVRINATTSDQFHEDVALVSASPWVSAVVLPKVESSSGIEHFRSEASREVDIVALIESSAGIIACDEIARSGVRRLMFGSVDYSAELGAPPGAGLFAYPRSRLVVASAAAGLPAPVDGPTTIIGDSAALRDETVEAFAVGMGGKLCIHPNQLVTVASVFATTLSERAWAQSVMSAFELNSGGVFVVNGEMIDAPLVARARKILET
jgi:citrate lyase subunit beta/citryl-CoA lyase